MKKNFFYLKNSVKDSRKISKLEEKFLKTFSIFFIIGHVILGLFKKQSAKEPTSLEFLE